MTKFISRTILKKTLLLLAVIACFAFLGFFLGQQRQRTSQDVQEIERLATPTFETKLNNEFEFPIEEAPVEEASFKISLMEAKKVKLIAMQGEPIQAEADQEFLVISLEIENKNNFPFEIDSQHYFRVKGEENKSYAPDFYNGAIEIPAVSTKKDELAFIVPAEQKQFKLLLGSVIEGGKEEIEINF